MFLIVIAILEVIILWLLPWWLSFGIVLLYSLWYFIDTNEYNGTREWRWFRELPVWKKCHNFDVLCTDKHYQRNSVRVYIFVGCESIYPLFWCVGLHGGQQNTTMYYVVPPRYMWIPIVRDVLMWSGAITFSTSNDAYTYNSVLISMVNAKKSVCCAGIPENDILSVMKHNQAIFVPVTVQDNLIQFLCDVKSALYDNPEDLAVKLNDYAEACIEK